MLTKIDKQIEAYDSRVGSSLQMISADQGRISVQDLEKALAVIKHKPEDQVGLAVIQKLDADKDGFVELEHVLDLVREEGLGTVQFDDWETETNIDQVSSSMMRPSLFLGKGAKLKTPNLGKKISSRSSGQRPLHRHPGLDTLTTAT
jgi:hypothetical protein